MSTILRQAGRADIAGMHQVRLAVRENRLVSLVLTEADYIEGIEVTGRGWVVEVASEVVGFAIGNAVTGNIWALFINPEHEGHGHGKRLHDTMTQWLFALGLPRLRLSTAPGTRAQRFYERAGWRLVDHLPSGEAFYELHGQGGAVAKDQDPAA